MKKNRLGISLFISTLILDQGLKLYVNKNIPPSKIQNIWGTVNLTHIVNGGIETQPYLKILVTIVLPIIVIIFLIKILVKEKNYTPIQRISLWSIAGGGFSNIIDRIRGEGVLDYIYISNVKIIPIFNMADFTVAIFSIIMLLSLIFESNTKRIK